MLTNSDVEYAYRLILGREPETPEIIEAHRKNLLDLRTLRRAFKASQEFKETASALVGQNSKPLNWPATQVETTASAEELSAMIRHIERVWSAYGETDPHWSVLTDDAYRAGKIAVSKDRFYETGKQNVDILEATAARCGVKLPKTAHCLELGCGVGRVTSWLAKRFAAVTAVDISAPHLALAATQLSGEGVTNVTWIRLGKLDGLVGFKGFGVFFSAIALQHNPPPIMAIILRDALRALAPGGVAYFQIPTYIKGYSFQSASYLKEASQEPKMEMHALPQSDLFRILAECGCRTLEIREDNYSGSAMMITNSVFAQRVG